MWHPRGEASGNKIGELLARNRIYISSVPNLQELYVNMFGDDGVRVVYTVESRGRRFLVIPLDAGDVDDPSLLFKDDPCRR